MKSFVEELVPHRQVCDGPGYAPSFWSTPRRSTGLFAREMLRRAGPDGFDQGATSPRL